MPFEKSNAQVFLIENLFLLTAELTWSIYRTEYLIKN